MKGIYYVYDKIGKVAYTEPKLMPNDLVAVSGFRNYLKAAPEDSAIKPDFFELKRLCTVDDEMNIVDHMQVPICQGTEVDSIFENLVEGYRNSSKEE